MFQFDKDTFFTDLWHKNYRFMRSHAYHQLYHRDLAGDAVSEAFARCLNYMDRAHPNPVAWLMLTLNRICLEINIKELRQQELLEAKSTYQLEFGIVELLPPSLEVGDAELLTLFYVERRSLVELADHFGTTPSVCKKRLYRARQKLKQLLGEGRS